MTATLDAGPVMLPDASIYAGDPLTITFKILGQDRTSKVFACQFRHRARDEAVLVSVGMTASLVGSDTVVTGTLGGDTAPGRQDGKTRLLGRSAHFDIEQQRQTGETDQTIAAGKLLVTEDVTR